MSTSRVGRKPVTIPAGVEVLIQGLDLTIKGPKGQLTMPLHPSIKIDLENNKELKVVAADDAGYSRNGSGSKLKKSIAGTIRAKIYNMVHGVTQGFERKLVLVGVGYRAQTKDNVLNLTIGFSHPVAIQAPEGVVFETPSLTEVIIKGVDKHLVGHVASKVRAVRPPEPYKGKGIRYFAEVIIRKETKKK
jgi:large subunit ribosomal protein L6